MAARGVARSIKNYAKGFSDAQIKVREATSNDPWGPSGTIMNEIAQLTYNEHDFVEIMDMIDRRLNDKGKNWRHVFKALLLLDYCLHVGSDNVVLYAKENIYVVKTLKEFQHVDDTGRDVGANVRQKAKDITSLLVDDARLKEERQSRHSMRDRMAGVGDYMNESLYGRGYDGTPSRPGGNGSNEEDRDMQRAMEESRRMAQSDARDREQGDADLAKAIQESEREARELEQKKRDKLARDNEKNLLDDNSDLFAPVTIQQPQQTGMSFASVPLGAQSNPYHWNQMQAQMTGLPQQYTGVAPFQTNQMMSPQYTNNAGFNSAMPTGAMQPGLHSLSTGNLQNMSPLGQQATLGSSSMMMNQPTGTPQKQSPMVTGSNNPFGPGYKAAQASASAQQVNPVSVQQTSSISTQQTAPVAMQQTGMSLLSSSAPSSQTLLHSQPADPRHAKLNSLLANRDDGQDTFGNTGNLRIPT
ncbi:hypothetical protein BJV82DRAFT_610996 [Fennellomyces sp. T-0311]|nr:hypothetical protein BJV82DRAFT_610996 [Fennellomyces sp. T-0311]